MACSEKPESNYTEALALEHWNWVVVWLKLVYVDAFVHGYKHGKEDSVKEKEWK